MTAHETARPRAGPPNSPAQASRRRRSGRPACRWCRCGCRCPGLERSLMGSKHQAAAQVAITTLRRHLPHLAHGVSRSADAGATARCSYARESVPRRACGAGTENATSAPGSRLGGCVRRPVRRRRRRVQVPPPRRQRKTLTRRVGRVCARRWRGGHGGHAGRIITLSPQSASIYQ